MAGFDSSPTDSEYGFSRPHLIGLACLGSGMALILGLSTHSQPEPSPRLKTETLAAASPVREAAPRPQPAVEESLLKPAPSPAKLPFLPTPAIAERLSPSAPTKLPPQQSVAAVAEEPPEKEPEINLRPNWNHLVEVELEADLRERVPTIGLSYLQAAKALKTMRTSQVTTISEKARRLGIPSKRPAPQAQEEKFDGPQETVLALLDQSTMKELPFQINSDCKLDQEDAQALQTTSRLLQRELARFEQFSSRGISSSSSSDSLSWQYQHHSPLAEVIRNGKAWEKESAVPGLVQILQVEPPAVRHVLVKKVAAHNSPEITRMLLDRALYDLSQEVRHAANEALQQRPLKDFRTELLAAFRYPWEPVAWHAAETLVMLKDAESVPYLIGLLDAPDPAAPYRDKSGQMVVRELVKINHMQNCLLCHAPSRGRKDMVTAPVPVPGERLPQVYYSSIRGSGIIFVRADVTYLRQDFSVMHNVEKQDYWPERQRFDYLVRTREAYPEEVAIFAKKSPREKHQYTQREAVLAALRSLTNEDPGTRSEDWQHLKQPNFSVYLKELSRK